jgi:hypothetical protein
MSRDLDAKIQKETKENVWMDKKDCLEKCIAQKNGSKSARRKAEMLSSLYV